MGCENSAGSNSPEETRKILWNILFLKNTYSFIKASIMDKAEYVTEQTELK